jgi:hypothetical protein
MNKRIKDLIQKDIKTKDLSHEEYEEIQNYFKGTGVVYNFIHKEICELCKNKPIIEWERIE